MINNNKISLATLVITSFSKSKLIVRVNLGSEPSFMGNLFPSFVNLCIGVDWNFVLKPSKENDGETKYDVWSDMLHFIKQKLGNDICNKQCFNLANDKMSYVGVVCKWFKIVFGTSTFM